MKKTNQTKKMNLNLLNGHSDEYWNELGKEIEDSVDRYLRSEILDDPEEIFYEIESKQLDTILYRKFHLGIEKQLKAIYFDDVNWRQINEINGEQINEIRHQFLTRIEFEVLDLIRLGLEEKLAEARKQNM